ncbi:unnamed protein product, partial [Iphiclides podalirius]
MSSGVFVIVCVIVSLLTTVQLFSDDADFGPNIDFSELAKEAETNKNDILGFLDQDKTREKYKELYRTLLNNLMSRNRKASTRRIVSGRNTSIAAVPWQVSLRERTYPICGGSIITDVWLVTAAHCLIKSRANELSVRLGTSWKTHGGEMYDVMESHVHPRYAGKAKSNDVGLVRLYAPLRFSAAVMPIAVISKAARLPANKPAIVSGWGKLREGGPSASYLQSSTILTIAMKLCRRSGLDKRSIDPASMFCAGSFSQPSPDACQGDSGGPIVQDGVLIGVVSWGLGCARGNFPGVYTRLSNPAIWDWLHKQVKNTSHYRT